MLETLVAGCEAHIITFEAFWVTVLLLLFLLGLDFSKGWFSARLATSPASPGCVLALIGWQLGVWLA